MEDCQNNEQLVATQPVENIVETDGSRMFTTSLIIAEIFEKEHKNVLRDIENLECSSDFRQLNFELSFHTVETGNGTIREFPAYRAMERQLTRPGYSLYIPPTEPDKVKQQRLIKILRGLIAYWAFVDKIPYCAAELALALHVGLERLEDLPEEGGGEIIQAAFDYLGEVSNRPTGDMDGPGATPNEMAMLRHMLTACGQWRFTRDQDFEEYFENLTGVNPRHPGRLSAHDVAKMLSTAAYLLHQTYQHTVDWNAITKEIAK